MTNMVIIGRSKFGNNNRISLVEGLPGLMNLEVGDYVEFHVEDGKLILRKETKKYSGFDFEGKEIEDRLKELESSKQEEVEGEDFDPDEIERKARENYERDKEIRRLKNQLKRRRATAVSTSVCLIKSTARRFAPGHWGAAARRPAAGAGRPRLPAGGASAPPGTRTGPPGPGAKG